MPSFINLTNSYHQAVGDTTHQALGDATRAIDHFLVTQEQYGIQQAIDNLAAGHTETADHLMTVWNLHKPHLDVPLTGSLAIELAAEIFIAYAGQNTAQGNMYREAAKDMINHADSAVKRVPTANGTRSLGNT